MPRELAACVERANLDPEVHVIALAGNTGFCGGYDLVASAEGKMEVADEAAPEDPRSTRHPGPQPRPRRHLGSVTDFQMMSRNVRGFMSLFHSEKPVVCKVHGYCVAGGTDMALLGSARRRGPGQDRLPARARLGSPHDGAVGVSDRPLAPAAAADGRLDRRHHRGRRGSPPRPRPLPSWTASSSRCSSGSLACRSTSSSCTSCSSTRRSTRRACTRLQVLGTVFDGVARHARGLRVPAPRRRGGLQGGREDRDAPFRDFGLER